MCPYSCPYMCSSYVFITCSVVSFVLICVLPCALTCPSTCLCVYVSMRPSMRPYVSFDVSMCLCVYVSFYVPFYESQRCPCLCLPPDLMRGEVACVCVCVCVCACARGRETVASGRRGGVCACVCVCVCVCLNPLAERRASSECLLGAARAKCLDALPIFQNTSSKIHPPKYILQNTSCITCIHCWFGKTTLIDTVLKAASFA